MKGDIWVDIRADRKKGLNYTQIGRKYGIDPRTAKKYAQSDKKPEYKNRPKESILDEYKDAIDTLLSEAPYSAVRVQEIITEQGYEGKYTIVKDYVRTMKKELNRQATIRFETMPGLQGQVDWAHFEKYRVFEDGKYKKLYCFLMILGFSRTRYIEFVTDMTTDTLLRCHVNAFRYFGGYPQEILYDNMKQVVVKRLLKQSDSTMNSQFEDFAGFYGYKPVLCRPYRGQTKGKIERTVSYVRGNFMVGIQYDSLQYLNNKAYAWCNKVNSKVHGTTNKVPLGELKKEKLNPLTREYIMDKIEFRRIGKDCLISYNGSKYSVPSKYALKEAAVRKIGNILSIYYQTELITLEIMDNYLEHAVKENTPALEILDHIFAREAESRRQKTANTRIQLAGFPYRKTLDDFDFDFQASIDKAQIMDLATMRFVHNSENVVFLGPPGVGKTHLAVALGIIAASSRFTTYYINCHRLIEILNKAHYENRLPEKLKTFSKHSVLIIDEIGYLPMDIQGANLFFQLIAKRYEKNTTIFTSNKPFSQWNEVFSDMTIAAAI